MPWQGSAPNESFQRTDGTRTGTTVWNQADNAGVKVISVDHDTHDQDIADGLNECLKRDGGNQPTANIPMNGWTLTGLASAAALTSPATAGQVGAGDHDWYGDLTGTDTYTVGAITGFTPAAYEAGMKVRCRVVNANATTTPTLNVNSIGAATIVLLDGTAPTPGDLPADSIAEFVYDGTNFRLIRSSTDFEIADAGTATTVFPLDVKHSTSGTAADNFGVGQTFTLENDAGSEVVAMRVISQLKDVTAAAEDASFLVQQIDGGTVKNRFQVFSTGNCSVYGSILTLNTDAIAQNSEIRAYDSTGTTERSFRFNDTTRIWEFEDSSGTLHPLPISTAYVGHTEWDKGALVLASAFTQAHGLGQTPKSFFCYLECTTAEGGYAIGDRIIADGKGDGGSSARGVTVSANATNIVAAIGAAITPIIATGNTAFTITAANWKVILAMLD